MNEKVKGGLETSQMENNNLNLGKPFGTLSLKPFEDIGFKIYANNEYIGFVGFSDIVNAISCNSEDKYPNGEFDVLDKIKSTF